MEVVLGKDDRIRIKDTKVNPWNRVCHLRITAANGDIFLGTGFLVGRRSVVTAGHCVYLHGNGGWAKSIEVTPGRNLSEKPFGVIPAKSLSSVRGWTAGRKRACDYGFIELSREPKPFPGAFAVKAYGDNYLTGKRLNTAGYPGDKAKIMPGSMWYHGREAKSISKTVITYDIDTAGGQSGSAVWITSGGSRTAVAIHTNGAPSGNSATRITADVLRNLSAWAKAAS
jgi:V8-like Glu-specific endopeptidase